MTNPAPEQPTRTTDDAAEKVVATVSAVAHGLLDAAIDGVSAFAKRVTKVVDEVRDLNTEPDKKPPRSAE